MFSKKATIIDEIFTVDLTLCSKCQIDGEDFVAYGMLSAYCKEAKFPPLSTDLSISKSPQILKKLTLRYPYQLIML